MAMSVGEATAAYNADINEEGVSPLQAVTGRQQPAQGDVLSGVGSRLAEHSLIDSKPTLARQVALRETARVAMVRMHFSRGLRRAELARARTTSLKDFPQPGDLCYFWRASKYNPKKKGAPQSRRKLELRRWFGPALMVAVERSQDGEAGANCFLSFRGQLTKCGLEHVRKASSLEQISFEAWEEAIKDVIHAAGNQPDLDEIPVPAARDGDDDGSDYEPSLVDDETPFPQESHDASGAQESPAELEEVEPLPLTQAEMVAFMQPGLASSRGTSVIPSTIGSSRRSSLASAAPAAEQSTAQPGTPVPSGSSSIAGTSP